jgi:hypothetical protein
VKVTSAADASLGATALAREIGLRLAEPTSVALALNGAPDDPSPHERNLNGAAALVLLHSALHKAFPQDGWLDRAETMLRYAARGALPSPSLYYGWAGIGFAALCAAAHGGRCAQFAARIGELVSGYVLQQVPTEPAELRSSHEYELIDGLAGLFLVLDPNAHAEARARIVAFLDWLSAPGHAARWRLPNAADPSLPGRYNTLGVAHGIGGVMAALALDAHTDQEYVVLDRLARLFARSAAQTAYGPQWPVDLECGVSDKAPFRVAWCHSSLGIAVALSNASAKLGDPMLAELARGSARGLAAMPRERWGMVDHTLCHGTAGNALLLRRLARAHGDARLAALSDELFEELVQGFDERSPLGYRSVVADAIVSPPGLLMGSAGIGLALLTLAEASDAGWMRLMAVA